MPRVTDTNSGTALLSQINGANARIEEARQRISTGKRINKPSDDPIGSEVVIRMRTAQAEIDQVRRNAGTAHDALQTADTAFESYLNILDQARSLIMQVSSDPISTDGRNVVANQLDGLRSAILNIANTRVEDRYIFGGTRQDAPPYDANGVAAATPTAQQTLQVEPQAAPIVTGVTAESVFADANGTIFAALQAVSTALRGTGDPVADQAALMTGLDRLKSFSDQSGVQRAVIGTNLTHVDEANSRLDSAFLAYEETAQNHESADFVESALELSEGQRTLEAILQANSPNRRRSLIDLLG